MKLFHGNGSVGLRRLLLLLWRCCREWRWEGGSSAGERVGSCMVVKREFAFV